MTGKFYFDTSIWIDIYDKRGYNGEVAMLLVKKIIFEDSIVLYYDVSIKELKHVGYSEEEINTLLRILKPNNIKRIHSTKEQREEAKRIATLRNVPKGDALHAIVARDNDAQFISRDKDFDQLKDVTKTKLPENFI